MSDWTIDDIPVQTGRTAVVTGANSGIGYATAEGLAGRGAHVVLAVRDRGRGERAAARIRSAHPNARVSLQALDLASLASVRRAADELTNRHERIDVLVNNAGVAPFRREVTADGFEMLFGVTHLGHFALTGLLLDHLLRAPGARVVTVSSNGHKVGRAGINFDDLQWERGFDSTGAYAQGKLANLMFTYELQRRLARGHTAIAVAAHPGFARTSMGQNSPRHLAPMLAILNRTVAQTPAQGALPILRAATDPGVLGGQYYGPARRSQYSGPPVVVASSDQSYRTDLQSRLWRVSEDLTGVVYPLGQELGYHKQ